MIEQAIKMIVALLAVGVLIAVMSNSALPLVIVAAVAYSLWRVAKSYPG